MKKYASKFLAVVSLLSLLLQSAYPVILAYEDTEAGNSTSCSLSVSRTSLTQGESVTFTLTSSIYGFSAYWKGTENGQSISEPVEGFSSTNYWQKTYPQDTSGIFSDYIEILNDEGSVICTTNTVTVTVNPKPQELSTCETKKIADCVRRECDPGIQKMVCIDKWQVIAPDSVSCDIEEKPGVATDQRCGIPEGQGATAPTGLAECFRQECDTNTNQMVCIDKWNICEPEGCTETEKPGRLFGQSCVTFAPGATTQPADTPAEPAPIITYRSKPICSLQAIPQTIQAGGEITWYINADPAGISASWIRPELNQPSRVEGYPEGSFPNWSRTYTYNQPATYTRQAVINYSSAPACTTNPITITINPSSVGAAFVEPDINLDFQGITPPVIITNESRQLATINQDVAVTTDQPPPDLPPLSPPLIADPSSQAQAEQEYAGAAFQRARENAEFLAEARQAGEEDKGNTAKDIGNAASNVGNVGLGAAQAIGGAAGNLFSGIGQLFQPQDQKRAEEAIKKAEGIYVEPGISTGIPTYCSAGDFNGTPETNPECYPQQRFEKAKEIGERAGFKVEGDPTNFAISLTGAPDLRAYTVLNEAPLTEEEKEAARKSAEALAKFAISLLPGGAFPELVEKSNELAAETFVAEAVCKQAGFVDSSYVRKLLAQTPKSGQKQRQEVLELGQQVNPQFRQQTEETRVLTYETLLARAKEQDPSLEGRLAEVSGLSQEEAKAKCGQETTALETKIKDLNTETAVMTSLEVVGALPVADVGVVAVKKSAQIAKPFVRKITDPIGNVAKGAWDATLGRIFGGAGKEIAQESAEKIGHVISEQQARQINSNVHTYFLDNLKRSGVQLGNDLEVKSVEGLLMVSHRNGANFAASAIDPFGISVPRILEYDFKNLNLTSIRNLVKAWEQTMAQGSVTKIGINVRRGDDALWKSLGYSPEKDGASLFTKEVKPVSNVTTPSTPVKTAAQALEQPDQPVHIDSSPVSAGVGNSPYGVREILTEEINKITGGRARVTVSKGMVTVFDERGRQIFGSGLTDKGPEMAASVFTEGRRSPFAEKILETWERAMAGLGYSKVFAEIFEDNGWEFLYRMGYRRTGDSHILVKELTPTTAEEIATRNATVTKQLIPVIPEEKLGELRSVADEVVAYVDARLRGESRRLSDDAFFANEAVAQYTEFYKNLPQTRLGGLTAEERERLRVSVVDATLVHEKDIKEHINPLVEQARKVYDYLVNGLAEAGFDKSRYAHIDSILDPRSFFIKSKDDLPKDAVAQNFFGRIYINKGYLNSGSIVKTCVHECNHGTFGHLVLEGKIPEQATQILKSLGPEFERPYSSYFLPSSVGEAQRNLIQTTFRAVEDRKDALEEGLVEWVAREVGEIPGLPEQLRHFAGTYEPQVDGVAALIGEMRRRSGTSTKEANLIITDAVLTGDLTMLIEKVGGGKALVDVLVKHMPPLKRANIASPVGQAELELARREAMNELRLNRGSDVVKPQSFVFPEIIKYALAADTPVSGGLVDQDLLDTLTKQILIKHQLIRAGELRQDFVEDVTRIDLFDTTPSRISGGYVISTGRGGTVEIEIKPDKYIVEIASIPEVDIKIPGVVDVKAGQETVIPVAIKKGTGKVEKTATLTGWQWLLNKLFGTVFAQEKKESPVQLVVFSDTNNNGKIDKDEQVLPWAGLKVELKKVNQDRTLSLIPGWNLVALEVLPSKTMNASTLLQEIAKQGGYATTVSVLENGAWKSFVVRGDKTYSGDDFPITPGKAYFVKALKSSVLVYQGQELVAPIKLNLASGWNGVGVPYSEKPYQAADFIDTLNTKGGGADTAGRWESGLWDTFVKQQDQKYGENFMIEQGRGYLLKVAKGLEFSP